MHGRVNIGTTSTRTALSAKTLRYYEDIGLVRPRRLANGYRDYSETDVHRLRFLKRARDLGFPIERCRELLRLYGDDARSSADVKALAAAQLAEVDRKLEELAALRRTLVRLVDACAGDERPECPILDDLADPPTSAGERSAAEDRRSDGHAA